jgi:hypothetical protein
MFLRGGGCFIIYVDNFQGWSSFTLYVDDEIQGRIPFYYAL